MIENFSERSFKSNLLMKRVMKGTLHLNKKGIVSEPLHFDKKQREFIISSMAEDACEEVIRTLDFHERCQCNGIDDGRRYWCFKQNNEIVGLTGYHYRLWDHPDIVWSAWFVAAPHVPALTKLGMLYNNMYVCLMNTNFSTMYIELLGGGTDSNIYSIFKSLGLEEVATFSNFHGLNKDMVVMKIDLAELREICRNKHDYNIAC